MNDSPVVREIDVSAATIVPPVPAVGMTTRVMRGTMWGVGGHGVIFLTTFIATPFVIRLLGAEGYGVLALINVLIGYLAFADMGMGTASTRFGADAHAKDDDCEEASVIWTSLLIAFVPSALFALALFFFAGFLVEQILQLPVFLQEEAILALRLAAIAYVARTIANVLNTPQLVRLRLDLNILITVGTSVLQIALVPVVLVLGGGLVSAVAVMMGATLANMIIHGIVSQRLLPSLSRPRISSSLLRPLMIFGGGLVVSTLADVLLVNSEKIMLPRFASVTALAHYAVAFNVAGMLALLPRVMCQVLLPAFSQLQAKPDREPLQRLYVRALRGTLLWIAPVVLLLCVAARPFFTLWAGAEYGRESTLPFYVLIVGLIFNIMSNVPYTLLMAYGRSDLIARFHLAELLPYLFCAALFVYLWGAVGAALAWSLRVIADALLFIAAERRISAFSFSLVPINRGSYMAAIAILFLPLLLTWNSVLAPGLLFSLVFLCVLSYCGLVWARVLTDEERNWALGQWPLYGLKRSD